jgi:hypothetical protein
MLLSWIFPSARRLRLARAGAACRSYEHPFFTLRRRFIIISALTCSIESAKNGLFLLKNPKTIEKGEHVGQFQSRFEGKMSVHFLNHHIQLL